MNLTKDTPHADMHELMLIHMSEGEPTWEQVSRFHRGLLATNWGRIEGLSLKVINWSGYPLDMIPTKTIQAAVEDALRPDVFPGFVEDGYTETDAEAHGRFERFTPNAY